MTRTKFARLMLSYARLYRRILNYGLPLVLVGLKDSRSLPSATRNFCVVSALAGMYLYP